MELMVPLKTIPTFFGVEETIARRLQHHADQQYPPCQQRKHNQHDSSILILRPADRYSGTNRCPVAKDYQICADPIRFAADNDGLLGRHVPPQQRLGHCINLVIVGAVRKSDASQRSATTGPTPSTSEAGWKFLFAILPSKIASLTGFCGRIACDVTKLNGQPRRCLDLSGAEREFGFRATTPFDVGLQKTIAWYQSHRGSTIFAGGAFPVKLAGISRVSWSHRTGFGL
jgi:hypothetical protein